MLFHARYSLSTNEGRVKCGTMLIDVFIAAARHEKIETQDAAQLTLLVNVEY